MTTAMKERPILFSGPMVRAILSGKKTQTRRIIPDRELSMWSGRDEHLFDLVNLCRYGTTGDRLWVRESWSPMPGFRPIPNPEKYDNKPAWYRADNDRPMWSGGPWKPSIHMPRAYSRLTLEITEVRVERLQDITEADAIAEGFEQTEFILARRRFELLWGEINGPDSWADNPWVWVVSFKKVEV